MKSLYIKCPRCELNYIQKKDKFCDVCKHEMKAGSLEMDELDEFEEDVELCPVCKTNYLLDGETICQSCQEEQQAYDKDDDIDWKSEVEKSSQDEDEELDLLPIEDNDEINEEMQNQFSKDLDDDFLDEDKFDEDFENDSYEDEDDFNNDFGDIDDVDEDEDDEEDYSDSEDDDDYEI